MSDPTAPVEGAAATETSAAPETTSAPEWAPVLDRVNELASTMDQRFQALTPQEPEAEPDDPWAGLFDQADPEPEPVQQALDPAALQSAFQTALQQANAPLMAQVQEMQNERAREQLYAEIPQLKDPAVAQDTIDRMISHFQASGAPREHVAWALNNPREIGIHFKAAEAEKLAQGQAPAGGQVPSLEAAGGAHPGGDGRQLNIAEQAYANRPAPMPKGFR